MELELKLLHQMNACDFLLFTKRLRCCLRGPVAFHAWILCEVAMVAASVVEVVAVVNIQRWTS